MKALQLRGNAGEILISDGWKTDRDTVIEAAQLIGKITSNALLEAARLSVKEMKQMLRDVESSREEAKAPVLLKGREVDDVARDLGNPLLAQITATEREVAVYSREQQRIRDEQARRVQAEREAEEKRIWEARQVEDRRIREEQAKANREIEAKRSAELAAARSAAEGRRIHAEADCAREQAEYRSQELRAEAELAATAAVGETRELFVAAPAPKLPVKMIPKAKVIDVVEVLRRNPELIRWEMNTAAVNKLLADGLRVIPGFEIWEEQEVRIR